MLGLRFCVRAFSSCGKRGPLFIAVRGPLTIAASLVAEHRLQTRRLSRCGSRAQLLRGTWDPPRPGLEPVSPALAGRLSTTAPPGRPPRLNSWLIAWSSLPPAINLQRTVISKEKIRLGKNTENLKVFIIPVRINFNCVRPLRICGCFTAVRFPFLVHGPYIFWSWKEKYICLMTWANVPSEKTMGRALSGTNIYGQVYGELWVARFGVKCPDLWEGYRNGISFTQTCGLGFPEKVWIYY